jgi:beta-glucosidase-like glycosyl hydrolase/CubicO group peptidase (beta-lactamase class C family)
MSKLFWGFHGLLILGLLLGSTFLPSQAPTVVEPYVPGNSFQAPNLLGNNRGMELWVDSVFSTMTDDQKIGQLIMGMAYSNQGEAHAQQLERQIANYHLGSLIFMQGGPVRQAKLTNRLQAKSKIPMLIAIDGEHGLSMRLDSTIAFPKAITLGALESTKGVYDMGAEIARQCRRIGVHVNFAPVADVNTDPANPVIGVRSFGEDKTNVARKAVAYMKGLQHHGVMANAKHFPGHGDTNKDSHLSLPVIDHPRQRIEEIELFPFRAMIADSLQSMMVAHLYMPAYEPEVNKATSLSAQVVNGLLQRELNFQGLVFTDGLNMQGVTKYYSTGEICVRAIEAGNDVLLAPADIAEGFKALKEAVAKGRISQETIDQKARKILSFKYLLGLHKEKPVKIEGIAADLNHPKALALRASLYEQAVTVVKNADKILPIIRLDSVQFGSLTIGHQSKNVFQEHLGYYTGKFEHHSVAGREVPKEQADRLVEKLGKKDVVIIGLHQLNNSSSQKYGITASAISLIGRLEKLTKVVVVVFGNPYCLKHLEQFNNLVCAYEDTPIVHGAVPQVLFGAVGTNATLPVTASQELPAGSGYRTISLGRMGYTLPEAVGMSSKMLQRIDSICHFAIMDDATPGCQVVVAKEGKIIFNKSYGFHTYSRTEPVSHESIYDLASLTKVLGTLQAVMLLEEQKRIDLHKRLKDYLPETIGTDKANITIKDLLLHQAGLQAFFPYWTRIMKKDVYDPHYLSAVKSDEFPTPITPWLYARHGLQDSVWRWTLEVPLSKKVPRVGSGYGYLYSDLGFITLKTLVERLSGLPLDRFLNENFYEPMGLGTLTYNPLEKFSKSQIPPTEMDIYLRKNLVHGYVHDPVAALQGGVGGHAGLFSNAHDVAVYMQMLLQEGYYGGRWYLQPETIDRFSIKPNETGKRGLGWDRPSIKGDEHNKLGLSSRSFGHTGFTGTCVWTDPDLKLTYVFLSNRIHPYVGNQKLIRNSIRNQVHRLIYESVLPMEHDVVGKVYNKS